MVSNIVCLLQPDESASFHDWAELSSIQGFERLTRKLIAVPKRGAVKAFIVLSLGLVRVEHLLVPRVAVRMGHLSILRYR